MITTNYHDQERIRGREMSFRPKNLNKKQNSEKIYLKENYNKIQQFSNFR